MPDITQTAEAICEVQLATGAIPWFPGGHVDPWDHVQAVMGLTLAGRHTEARRGLQWLADAQRADGSWGARYDHGACTDPTTDANFCAYPATGLWHYWLVTGDLATVSRFWPMVNRGLLAIASLQNEHGAFWRARDVRGQTCYEALITGNASIGFSLRCASALATLVGEANQPWLAAATRCHHALVDHPELFTAKPRHAMDWYYPVLTGAITGSAAHARLAKRWSDFVVDGLGIRCVDDHPWVTGAETCELVLALDSIGQVAQARSLFNSIQQLRGADGHYWTGLVYTDGKHWPVEQSTWTSATVLLAADALEPSTAGSGLFRGVGLPVLERSAPCLAS